jgi:hypothetical protein
VFPGAPVVVVIFEKAHLARCACAACGSGSGLHMYAGTVPMSSQAHSPCP